MSRPYPDTGTDSNGDLYLRDTSKMWSEWAAIIDFRISNEISGRRPPGGMATWDEFWVELIKANETGRQHPHKYIRYLLEQREEANLPRLSIDNGK